jgi:hypothetical protein
VKRGEPRGPLTELELCHGGNSFDRPSDTSRLAFELEAEYRKTLQQTPETTGEELHAHLHRHRN